MRKRCIQMPFLIRKGSCSRKIRSASLIGALLTASGGAAGIELVLAVGFVAVTVMYVLNADMTSLINPAWGR